MASSSANPLAVGDLSLTASECEGSDYEDMESIGNRGDEKREIIIISDDEESSGGIMTTVETTNSINECSKQVTVSYKAPRFEEQTTKNLKKWIVRKFTEDARHDLSVIKSNDETSSHSDSGIMTTAEITNPTTDGCKQMTASEEVPHFEEQSTRMITKDVSDAQKKESMCTHVSMKASRHDQSEKSSECVGGIMISETTNSVNECGQQVTTSDKVQHFEEQITQMYTKDGDVAQQKESRLDDDVTLKESRSLSRAMEANKGNRQNKSQKSDEGVSKGTKSIITYSSEIKPVTHKDIPVTTSFNYAYKANNPFMGFLNNQASYATKREGSVLRNDAYNTRYNVSSSSLKFVSKASSFDWEPTKGFRSEFLISQGVSIPDIQFDPNRKHIGDVVQASEVQNDDGPTQEVNIHKLDSVAVGDTHKGTKLHREHKPLRCFSAALIEHVKGLLKSSWRDGKLSKDAYKLIVKKTVDKVITTLPSKDIPNIKDYLTSSETKLMKLVEGYTAKYGKDMKSFSCKGATIIHAKSYLH